MDVEAYIEELERLVAESRPVPLSASVMVSRPQLEEAVAGLRAQLPEEMRQARWVLKERDEVLEQAQREADRLLADARVEAERRVSESEVVQEARRAADQILDEARDRARVLRLEAEDYVDGKLANFEIVLQRTMHAVQKGRERLRGRLASDELADDPLAPEDEPPGGHLYDHESGA